MKPYGCSNKPRPEAGKPLAVRKGWTQVPDSEGKPNFNVINVIEIPFVQTTACQYDISATDPRCSECEFKKEVK